MKKLLSTLLILIVVSVSFLNAEVNGEAVHHYLFGQIRHFIHFDVKLLEEVLPFNLDSPQVQFNPRPDTIATGLRIGTYTLAANTPYVQVVVSHNPLTLRGRLTEENTSINYRLYLMTEPEGPGFISTKGEEVTINGTSVADGNMILLPNMYMYVSLDEEDSASTDNVRNALLDGTYESTIVFELWVGQ